MSDSQCTRTYIVQPGDFCDKISAAQNVPTYQLLMLNPEIDKDCTNLIPGQHLCLGTHDEDCTTTHVVQAGDDCDIVTSMYHIKRKVLDENNPQLNKPCTNMYIGEVLCVAPTVTVPLQWCD